MQQSCGRIKDDLLFFEEIFDSSVFTPLSWLLVLSFTPSVPNLIPDQGGLYHRTAIHASMEGAVF